MSKTPSKSAYADALTIVAAGDRGTIEDATKALEPALASIKEAYAAIDAARSTYEVPAGVTPSSIRSTLDNWYTTLMSFGQSIESMKRDGDSRIAAYDAPPASSSPPAS